jgi:hypothetical protein
MLLYDKNNAWFFQWHIKHSQLFETSHATIITNKHIIKIISSMICLSLSHSLNKLPLHHYKYEIFYSSPTPINLFETTLKDNNQHRPEG